jgi:hypothetical protein
MNFNDKRQEWIRKFIVAEEADLARRRAGIGSVVRYTRNIRDEGHESDQDPDRDSDDDDYYCQFDVEDEDDEDEDDEDEGEGI